MAADEITRRDAIKIAMLGAATLATGCSSLGLNHQEETNMNNDYEALIIGGGPAGLTAGMTLGRMSRRALLCDDNRPRNAPSSHVNNFPSRDGINPVEWRKETRKNLEKYKTIESAAATVTSVQKNGHGFTAKLSTGQTVKAKKIILAYGVIDTLPPIQGFKELWGKSIFHCPFCHGYENRGSRLGFVGNGDLMFHALPMIYDLASDLVIFTNGKATFNPENLQLLKKNKVTLIEEPIQELEYEGESLKGVTLSDGKFVERQYLFLGPILPFKLKSDIGEKLGCEKNQFGFYKVNERNGTSFPGVYACGDNMSMGHSVLLAAAAGVMAGSAVSAELLHEKMLE
jgi:thioredoxin reductase